MSTSKLYIDPAHVAAAEKDDWAKFVLLLVTVTRNGRCSFDLLFIFYFIFLSIQRLCPDREPLLHQ